MWKNITAAAIGAIIAGVVLIIFGIPGALKDNVNNLTARISKLEGKVEIITSLQRDFTTLQKKVKEVQNKVESSALLVKITEPKDGERVSHKTVIEGTYTQNEKNLDLWIVVQPVDSPFYHPQPGPIPKEPKMNWTSIAYIGELPNDNAGEEFIIYLVSAPIQGSKVFSDYLEKSNTKKEWLGLEVLPSIVTALDSVKVIRR